MPYHTLESEVNDCRDRITPGGCNRKSGIKLAKTLEKEFGKEETIEFLKKFTTEGLLQLGKDQARGKSDLSLKGYTRVK